jgi:Flp pilus assembly protein TadD
MVIDSNREEVQPQVEPLKCVGCQGTPQPGYKVALCQQCRTKFARKPVPVAIKCAGLAVTIAVAFSLIRIPSSMQGAIAFELGQRYEAQSDYKGAVAEYQKAVDAFPDSTLAIARLGIVEYRLGDFSNAARTLSKLAGRKTDAALVSEVNSVIREIERESR